MTELPERDGESASIPLCVDLDGTLLRTDLLVEGLVHLVSARSAEFWGAPASLGRGLGSLKRHVMKSATNLDFDLLPVRRDVLAFARQQASTGREVVLVTAADQSAAARAVAGMNLFAHVFGSSPDLNLKASAKACFLVERYGMERFDYVGDSRADVPVWRAARRRFVVGPLADKRWRPDLRLERVPARSEDRDEVSVESAWWRALRPHQWTKNALIFVPLLTSGLLLDAAAAARAIGAFALFSVIASGTYIINDILDVPGDRRHPTKRARPFASGQIPLAAGLVVGPALVAAGLSASLLITAGLAVSLLAYTAATLIYSFRLKSAVLIDVTVLAGLYALRLLAGAAAVGVAISFWLLASTVFGFFSLALAKRYAELQRYPDSIDRAINRRGYRRSDSEPVLALGSSSGVAAVVILALYIHDSDITSTYAYPVLLWLIVPCALYWISRVWVVASRGELHDDPIVWAVGDRISLGLAAVVGTLYLAARYLW